MHRISKPAAPPVNNNKRPLLPGGPPEPFDLSYVPAWEKYRVNPLGAAQSADTASKKVKKFKAEVDKLESEVMQTQQKIHTLLKDIQTNEKYLIQNLMRRTTTTVPKKKAVAKKKKVAAPAKKKKKGTTATKKKASVPKKKTTTAKKSASSTKKSKKN